MRERYSQIGFDGFSEHEILEMTLFWCLPQRNTNEIAHELLNAFGSLDRVLSANKQALMRVYGIQEQTAFYLNFLNDLFCSFEKRRIDKLCLPDGKSDEAKILRELYAVFCGRQDERLVVIFLNSAGEKISSELMGIGISNRMEVSARHIVREAVRFDCARAIIAHNHPSGLLIPSQADMVFTNMLAKRLSDVGVVLYAHYLIANRSYLIIGEDYRCYPGKEQYDLSEVSP